jgi:hypothetical protein
VELAATPAALSIPPNRWRRKSGSALGFVCVAHCGVPTAAAVHLMDQAIGCSAPIALPEYLQLYLKSSLDF